MLFFSSEKIRNFISTVNKITAVHVIGSNNDPYIVTYYLSTVDHNQKRKITKIPTCNSKKPELYAIQISIKYPDWQHK